MRIERNNLGQSVLIIVIENMGMYGNVCVAAVAHCML